jgi:hypothetical protein
MAMRITFPGVNITVPGHYGPLCSCGSPILFDQFRKLKTGKCDKCNGFKIHNCEEAYKEVNRYDPNIVNGIDNEFWFDGKDWYGELSVKGSTDLFTPLYHFKLTNCPFCGKDLKEFE